MLKRAFLGGALPMVSGVLLIVFIIGSACTLNAAGSAKLQLVDSKWVEGHKKEIVLLDCRPGITADSTRIPGATSAPFTMFHSDMGLPVGPGWATLLPAAEVSKQIASLGISKGSKVVVYSNAVDAYSGCVAWALMVAGVGDVFLLNGGIEAWVKAGKQLVKEASVVKPGDYSVASLNGDMVCNTADIKAALKDSLHYTLVDSRSAEEVKDGYIPGAIHVNYMEMIDTKTNTLKTDKELTALFSGKGIVKNKNILVYCAIGVRSGYMTLMLKRIGYPDVKNYDESIKVWAADSTNPVIKP